MTLGARIVKRAMDLAIAIPAIIILAPIMAIVAIGVGVKLGRPVLFRQTRPGLDARPFSLVKFRTMRDAAGPDGRPLPDAARMTPFGGKLRQTTLDELPALFNVVRGELSLVGPRPLLMEYLPRYTAEQARRHEVKPGLTGWAVVHGRNALSWEERFKLDVWYVDHWSLWLDIKILFLTVVKVVKADDVTQPGRATMDPFMGNRP